MQNRTSETACLLHEQLHSRLCAYMRNCDYAGVEVLPSLALPPHILEGHKPVAKAEGGACWALQPGRRTLQGHCWACTRNCACSRQTL